MSMSFEMESLRIVDKIIEGGEHWLSEAVRSEDPEDEILDAIEMLLRQLSLRFNDDGDTARGLIAHTVMRLAMQNVADAIDAATDH